MAEYIEREALLKDARKNKAIGLCEADIVDVQDLINSQPAADVVEVVRCKDCRFCKKHPTSDKVNMCTNEQQWVTEYYPLVNDDDFCSYGERKETDEECI